MKSHTSATDRLDWCVSVANAVALMLAVLALAMVGVRAMVRLEPRWDTFWYHIPFAARRAGMRIPYEFPVDLQERFEGFPPLAEFVQGILWRLTGSIHATGVVNYLALLLFLYFCHRKLSARAWIVAIVALTAPLILIHASTSYVDLFGNALLAIGVTCFVAMFLFDRFEDRSLLIWGLLGLASAAWTKFQLMPITAVFLVGFLVVYGMRVGNPAYRQLFLLVACGVLLAAGPYLKNLVLYHNPVWPVRMPVMGDLFPYTDDVRRMRQTDSPPPLLHLSQFKLFFHSLLEIDHPTRYAYRERWIIDQGNASLAFRMGGFWNIAVITGILAAGFLATLYDRRKGIIVVGSIAAFLCLFAILPQSHDLRYYQFLPLAWAAIIAMLLPRIRERHPAIALILLSILVAEFLYVSDINRSYYRVERRGYVEAARVWNIPPWWEKLERGRTYCAVGFAPAAIMLTGPSMTEFHIVDRNSVQLCPPGIPVIERGKD